MSIRLLRTLILALLLSLVFGSRVSAQCCATGSPVGASVYIGVIGEGNLRALTFFRHNYSNTYYHGSQKVDTGNILKHSQYNFAGIGLGYGLTKRFTLEADLGYFINKSQVFNYIDFTETGKGLSNGEVRAKYGLLIKPLQNIELTAGVGMRYPFSRTPQRENGVQLSRDVQPSTNAFGVSGLLFFNKGFPERKMRFFSMNKFDYNFSDKQDYQFGSVVYLAVFGTKMLAPNFMFLLQCRGEFKGQDKDNGVVRQNTGSTLVVLSPQLSYAIAGKWNLTLVYDMPVYKHYTGKQLTPSYSFALGLSRDFGLFKPKLKAFDPQQ